MKAKALRLYGKEDLRLDEYELPEIKDDEILARVVSDSICMSSYKATSQGADHKRVPNDVADNPVIIGHEFCGYIVEVGAKWQDQFKPGDKFVIQPALNYKGSLFSPGYSYPHIGGDATYVVIPEEVMLCGCLLPYDGDAFFYGSLTEPMSCIGLERISRLTSSICGRLAPWRRMCQRRSSHASYRSKICCTRLKTRKMSVSASTTITLDRS